MLIPTTQTKMAAPNPSAVHWVGKPMALNNSPTTVKPSNRRTYADKAAASVISGSRILTQAMIQLPLTKKATMDVVPRTTPSAASGPADIQPTTPSTAATPAAVSIVGRESGARQAGRPDDAASFA